MDSADNLYVGGYFDETISKITLVGVHWVASASPIGRVQKLLRRRDRHDARFQSPSGMAVDAVGTF